MTGGKSPIDYLKAYLTNLYLSADSEKVQEAIEAGLSFCCYLSVELVKKWMYCVSFMENSAASSNAESHKIVWYKLIIYLYLIK